MRAFLLGAGGHGRVVLDAARAAQGVEVVAIVDADPAKRGTSFEGLEVVGDESVIPTLMAQGIAAAVLGIGHIDVTPVRRALFARLAALGLALPTVVHPAATIAPTARLGDATVVFAGAVVNPRAEIGRNVIVNTAAVVDHNVVVGDHAHIAPGALLAGGVSVGEGTLIGMGASVIQGVRIGRDVAVGAGAVVLRDLPDGARVGGVPARPISRR